MSQSRRKSSRSRKIDRDRAFEQLFHKKVMDRVSRWLECLGVSLRDIRDVAQDVFLAAHRSFHTYNPSQSTPERWLNRIAVHVVVHYRNRARRDRREELTSSDFEDRVDETPAPDELLGSEQLRLMTLELLQMLEVNVREVLIAHDLEGVPMTEIARQRGIPVSTAYKWRTRGILAFQKILAEREHHQKNGADSSETCGGEPQKKVNVPHAA